MKNKVDVIALKYKKITIYNSTFLYVPVGIIKGYYDLETNLVVDNMTGEEFGIIDDETIYYSEMEYGYYKNKSIISIKEENDGELLESTIRNYYLDNNKDLFIREEFLTQEEKEKMKELVEVHIKQNQHI